MRDARNDRLDSWKTIAGYLGREVRTAIRWEKEKGLPVHRVPGGKRHAVFAYPNELDDWLRGPAGLLDKTGQEAIPPHQAESVPVRDRLPSGKSFTIRKLGYFIGSSLLALLLLGGGFALYRWTRPGPPERVTVSGHSIQAWDEKGRLAWEHRFPHPLETAFMQLGDRDGDGRNDFVAVVTQYKGEEANQSNDLFCFDGGGRLLWHYAPEFTLSSGDRQYQPPWGYSAMTLTPKSKPKYIWVAFHQMVWWPSCLVRLDLEGHAAMRFINAGWITTLESYDNASGSWVLAGGISNEYEAGMLAVIKDDASESISPQLEGSRYILDNPPRQGPHRYFLFPRSELNLATNFPINVAYGIFARQNEIEVRTGEAEGVDSRGTVFGIYLLSRDFELSDITRTETYWELHRRLEKEGRIRHPVERCPERNAPGIPEWDSERGWTVASPRPVFTSK
jgi:hypothetical protein